MLSTRQFCKTENISAEEMDLHGIITGIFYYAGLYVQLNAAVNGALGEPDNHTSMKVLFTEVPHDITTQSGEDVEMACSFHGVGSPSNSLEIQWWYIKEPTTWQEKSYRTNNDSPLEETIKDAIKISVVKVAGSNISHKLRLSSVKPSDNGTYECRVIDYSSTVTQHHHARAYLHVEPNMSLSSDDTRQQEPVLLHPQFPPGRGKGAEEEIF
uniref:V-set and transmembrane domain containing 2 like n=1 Tax=Gouania willdenowi TaxID=441366 RepID=A0A8C5GW56_GOUWI